MEKATLLPTWGSILAHAPQRGHTLRLLDEEGMGRTTGLPGHLETIGLQVPRGGTEEGPDAGV
jgi:hypothetical protein